MNFCKQVTKLITAVLVAGFVSHASADITVVMNDASALSTVHGRIDSVETYVYQGEKRVLVRARTEDGKPFNVIYSGTSYAYGLTELEAFNSISRVRFNGFDARLYISLPVEYLGIKVIPFMN